MVDTAPPASPALEAALRSVRAVIEEEAKASIPGTAAHEQADQVASDLRQEIAALQKKLEEANAAREAAEQKLAAAQPATAKPASPSCLDALFKCFSGDEQREAERAKLRERVAPQLRAKMEQVFKNASLNSKDDTKHIKDSGFDSIAIKALSQAAAKEMDVSPDILTEKVPVGPETTAAQLMEQLLEVGVEQAVAKALEDGGYGTKAHHTSAPDDRIRDTDPDATAPTVAMEPQQLLAEAELSHLPESVFGVWADCRKAAAQGRAPLLRYLKDVGNVSKLQDRQALATALAKAMRAGQI